MKRLNGPRSTGTRAEAPIDISIVIVTYNSHRLVHKCLASVACFDWADLSYEVIVVDNASRDSTVAELRESPVPVKIIESAYNLGFSKACNLGAGIAGGRYLLFLNPDTVLISGSAADLVRVYEADENVGILGALLLRPNGSIDHACARRIPTLKSAIQYLVAGSGSYLATINDGETASEVDAVNGAFLFISADVFLASGRWDERYWMYGEDLDLCRQVQGLGLGVFVLPQVVAIHEKGASSGSHRSPRVNLAFHWSMVLYLRKYRPVGAPLRAVAYVGIMLRWAAIEALRVARLAARIGRAQSKSHQEPQ